MKKKFIMLVMMALVCFAISCDGSNKKVQRNASENVTLIFATQDNQQSPAYDGYRAFATKLSELSGGTMTVEFVQMTKYSSVQDMLDAMFSGTFDIASAGYSNLDYTIPDLFILSQILRDFEHLSKILESPFGKRLQAQFYDVGVVVSSPWYMGTRRTTSNTPINELADFKKLKMRTVPSEAGKVFATHMGTEVIPLSFAELPNALKDGRVNAQENPLSIIEASKFYEDQKYIAMTEHAISSTGIFLNKAKYDTFTPEQKMCYNTAIIYGGEVASDIVAQNEANLLDKLVTEYGMTVTYPDLAELRAAMEPHYDTLREIYGSVVDELLSIE